MLNSWLTLLPPVLVIIAAALTKRIHPSLLIGIITASIVASNGALQAAARLSFSSLWQTATDLDNIYLYSFLLAIGILVSLLSKAGFAISFAHAVTQRIKSARQAQYASMGVSALLFIDDYLSILTSGYVMSPITDRFKIAREKLAFLVHSMAGPIVILAPVSSWVAAILSYIEQAGISTNNEINIRIFADPFFIYLESIPFMLYSAMTILSLWFIVHGKLSYGPMAQYDDQAADQKAPELSAHGPASSRDLLIPLIVLVGGIAFGLPFAGGYYLFGGTHTLIESLKYNEHPFLVMLLAAIAAISATMWRAWRRKVIAQSQIIPTFKEGYDLMAAAISMVYLASTLSGLLANHVGTGQYLASALIGAVPLFLLPAMFFIVSLISTIATGSAWGNFALMIPIAIPMLTSLSGLPMPIDPRSLPFLLPVLGAIFSGSVCGDHISPMSETTIMTAASTGTRPLVHAYTQIFYALPAIIATCLGYVAMGLLIGMNPLFNVLICLVLSSVICILMLIWSNKKK